MTDTKDAAAEPIRQGELSHNEIMVIMGGLLLAMLLAALDQTIVSTALPTIVAELKGATHLSWVVTAYLLTSTIVTPLYGKVGDMFGRKKILLFAISAFLVGSVLCGAAQNMGQLIGFRALQGIGAGGLFSLSMAIVGDIVPPRDRGKYQGYFGAVFGMASVIGPLLGGYLTESISWRWIFYVNIPVGLVALAVVTSRLHLAVRRVEHKVDTLGAAFMAAAVSCLLLVTVWGGGHPAKGVTQRFTGYPWGSTEILGLLVAGIVLLGAFIWQERRHPEPLIPLELFKNRVFSVSVALSFLSGGAMFGAIIFIPQFQQIVRGFSPMESGLLMIPMTVGIVTGAVGSGKLISKIGRYKIFPVVGTALMIVGMLLLSLISVGTSQWWLSVWMIVVGFAIGLYMQVTTLAVQNAVEFKYMGTGTSATIFFRTLGGSFGTAAFGAILNNRLHYGLSKSVSPEQLNGLRLDELSHKYIAAQATSPQIYSAYAHAVHVVFLCAVPVAVLAFGLALLLPDKPLRTNSAVSADKAGDEDHQAVPAFE